MSWAVAHSRIGASTDPSGAIKARWPGWGKTWLSEAFRPQRGAMTPKLPGPSQRKPCVRAILRQVCASSGEPAVAMATIRVPRWPSSVNRVGSVAGGVAMNRQFRGVRQVGQALEGWHVLNARMAAVDQEQFALETARQQIAGQRRTDGAGSLAGADQRHGSGLEQRP